MLENHTLFGKTDSFRAEQDHILELQAVTSHMNLHRDACVRFPHAPLFQKRFWGACANITLLYSTAAKPGADADKCNARVKHDMNQRNNLAMIDATVNAQVSLEL